MYEGEDRVDDGEFADASVEHNVVDPAGRPLYLEVLLDIGRTVPINRFNEFACFRFGVAAGHNATNLFFGGRIQEDAKRVRAIFKEVLGAAADDHTVASFGDFEHDVPGDTQDALAIDELELRRIDASFVAATHEGFE